MREVNDSNFAEIMMDEADAANRVVIVEYGAAWCAPCKQVGQALRQVEIERPGKVDIFTTDIDENPKLGAGKISIPQIDIYVKGKLVESHFGSMSKRQLLTAVDKYSTVS